MTRRSSDDDGQSERSRRGGLVRLYATVTTRAWWAFLALVAVGIYFAVTMLPSLTAAGGGGLSFVNEDAPAVAAQARAAQLFGLPLITRIAVVQHDPDGLSAETIERSVRHATDVSRPALEGRAAPPLLFALPVVNGTPAAPAALPPQLAGDAAVLGRAFSDTRLPPPLSGLLGTPTTIVTYLFVDPTTNPFIQQDVARAYTATMTAPEDHLSGFSGQIPFQLEQGNVVNRNIEAVEIASVLAVGLVVGFVFRSFLAPLVTLVTAGASYVVADRVVGYAADLANVSAPGQLEPVLVALALGVSTDYSILFLSGARRRLRERETGLAAARGSVEDYLTIVLVAGVTVTAGVAALSVAETSAFEAFGPGLALTVLCTLVVSVLLVPPLVAMLGRAAFWPGMSLRRPSLPTQTVLGIDSDPDAGGARFVRLITRRRGVAATTVVVVTVVLALATVPLAGLQEAVSPMGSLPPGNPIRTAWEDASDGFAPGILSPTEFVVTAPGIVDRPANLVALEGALLAEPGVAGVIGPGLGRIPPSADVPVSVFSGPRGDTVRILVVLDADPVGGQAISDLRDLEDRLPGLLAQSGLAGAGVETAGDTAIGLGIVDSARGDLGRVAVVVALVDLLLLVIFLRALVAPLYLLVSSALVVGAALGLTTLVFGDLDDSGLIFFVPFAAGALLMSLGADYAVFGIGDVWHAARTRPLADALVEAVPRSTRAISAAGITLAISFGLVALIPLDAFRQLAFAMAVGVAIDTFIVRKFVLPALIWWVGPVSAWPGHALSRSRPRSDSAGAGVGA